MIRVIKAVAAVYVLGAVVVAFVGLDTTVQEASADEKKKPQPEYIGSAKCKKCHIKQYKSFMKTPLATSFESLKPGVKVEEKKKAKLDPKKDYTKDPTCLKCHTAGYGEHSGYPAVVKGKAWTDAEKAQAKLNEGVTCEACHGPGSLYSPFKKKNKKYKRSEIRALGAISPPTEASCMPCHVKECPTMPADYKFDAAAEMKSEAVHARKKLKYDHDD
ncbi:MAG: cytochrome c family protein [Planctomycetota bacterium]|nr:cytochrome c family protein [Planctomycetota bacterium]